MRVVAIVGPSKAGKTYLLKKLAGDSARWGFTNSPELLDLDEDLGSGHRSCVRGAIELVRSRASKSLGSLLVNVGAGQVVQPDFRDFLQSEPDLFSVAVWCDEQTFRSRHSIETGDHEVQNNYSPELQALWQTCRELGHLVDTSTPITKEQSLTDLVRIILQVTVS